MATSRPKGKKHWSRLSTNCRNKRDLDTMSLDDLYNHLKVYEPEVQKKSDSQNMAFIFSSKNNNGNKEDNTTGVLTASTQATLLGSAGLPRVKTGEGETTTDNGLSKNMLFHYKAGLSQVKELENLKNEKEGLKSKLTCFKSATKDLDHLIGSQRSDKINEGLGCSAVSPPPAQVYSPPKKDMSWTGLLEFANDTITDYTRPFPSVESNISYLFDYEPFDRGYVSFGQGGCKITSKGTIKTGKLEFENVYFVKDLKTPRQHNMYLIDLNNIVLHKDLTCLVAKASADECMLWHRRLEIENLKELRVKIIRYDNGGEFRNKEMNDFCSRKGIKRESSNARTPQHNGITERRNRTLIEAVRTMLVDAKLPVTFWAEAVNTGCYV
nr:putative ribonuclease H-like domain-containing protein [Tanacetum cinerariifolium]